jgi:hypothetical protein
MVLRILKVAVIALAAAACATDGGLARSRMRSLLSKAPPDAAVKVIVLNVEAERGTVVAGEGTLADVRRTPGVLQADRGGGRNEILVVADLDADSSYFVDALRPRYRVYVVREFLREDLAGD